MPIPAAQTAAQSAPQPSSPIAANPAPLSPAPLAPASQPGQLPPPRFSDWAMV